MRRGPTLLLLAATAATAAFVAAQLPGLSDVQGWFYRPRHRGLGEAWTFVLAALGLPALVWGGLGLARKGRDRAAAGMLFLAALGGQLAMIPLDAEGVGRVWRRHIGGHGQFLQVARDRRDQWLETLRNYDSLAKRRELGAFAPAKPPGALAVYMAMDAVAQWHVLDPVLEPWAREARQRPRLKNVARTVALSMWLMPLMTALIAPMIVWVGLRLFADRAAGHGGALLHLSAPAVLLITYHLDGAVYPLLGLTACGLVASGARHARIPESVAGGAVLALAIYVTFSLLPVALLTAGALAVVMWDRRHEVTGSWLWYRAAWHLAAVFGGFLLVLALLRFGLGFELYPRLQHALQYHQQWKRAVPDWPWAGWALVEFGLYVGVPLMGAWGVRAGSAVPRLVKRDPGGADIAAAGSALVMLLLTLAGGTNEVARMWLPLVPFIALVAATGMRPIGRHGDWRRSVAWLATCQAVLALVLKANQPW